MIKNSIELNVAANAGSQVTKRLMVNANISYAARIKNMMKETKNADAKKMNIENVKENV